MSDENRIPLYSCGYKQAFNKQRDRKPRRITLKFKGK